MCTGFNRGEPAHRSCWGRVCGSCWQSVKERTYEGLTITGVGVGAEGRAGSGVRGTPTRPSLRLALNMVVSSDIHRNL